MSAFLVHEEHIAALVGTYLAMKDSHTEEPDTLQIIEFASTLYVANMLSVEDRYKDNAGAISQFREEFENSPVLLRQIARWRAQPLTPGQLFKALDCYEYQACEAQDWEHSAAAQLCRSMRVRACMRVVDYKEFPWGIDAPPPAMKSHRRAG